MLSGADALLAQVEAECGRQERLDKLEVIDGDVLAKTHFDDLKYIWDGILPDSGIAVCAASKAAGKTLLLLQLADAITKGCPFMGVETTPSTVLFLELELSKRRTAQRLAKMGITPNKDLKFAWRWQQGEAGIRDLTDYVRAKKIQLVVVDVLQRLWPPEQDSNSYGDAYNVLGPLRAMANELNVLVLLVTHLRKAESADYLNSVIGSVGITANADVVLSLTRTRGEDEAVLIVDGNDIESKKIAMKFSPNPLGFVQSNADPAMAGQTQGRKEIVDFIKQHGGTASTHEIAAALGKTDTNTSHRLRKLVDERLIVSTGYGKYSILTPCQSDQGDQSRSHENQQTLTTLTTLTGPLPVKGAIDRLLDFPAMAPKPDEPEPDENQALEVFR